MSGVDQAIVEHLKTKSDLKAERIREKLDPEQFLDALSEIIQISVDCKIGELSRLKFQSDIYLALLKKCLPDLKAIEVKVDTINRPKPGLVININENN